MTYSVNNNDNWLTTPIAQHIWQTKYRRQEVGKELDSNIEESWQRVARAVAAVELAGQALWQQRFFEVLRGFDFLPGGRILAGAGTGHRVTLFNCFVMGQIEDDIESIFDALKEGAITMQAGGGVGYDFSTLRPMSCVARATGRIASGPVSFMQIWDAMCNTLLSTGARRGAMLASLRCDHPDIGAFIEAKCDFQQLRHFNISVQVTDAFMQAVESDASWPLIFPNDSLEPDSHAEIVMRSWPGFIEPVRCRVLARRSARELWHRIMSAAYGSAEPGVLFVDRINEFNNLNYRESITTTNPCGEIPLPPYGACNLGSLNLTRFVQNPFTAKARLDIEAIRHTTEVATRLLDNVVDCSRFPLDEQREQAQGSRRIGLGITGLSDALIMLGLHYGEEAARHEAARAMETVCHTAYRSSIQLAQEKGSFPFFKRQAYLESRFVQSLPQDIQNGIKEHGIRNSHLTAIAPTGTISLLANNISSGIEPVFDFWFMRRILDRKGEYQSFELEDYAIRHWSQQGRDTNHLPSAFVTAQSLPPLAQLKMQAALQPHVDNAISKTIHVPQDYPFKDFQSLYIQAYEHGLKGCTTFRPNPLTGEILSSNTGTHCCSIEREGE